MIVWKGITTKDTLITDGLLKRIPLHEDTRQRFVSKMVSLERAMPSIEHVISIAPRNITHLH